MWNNNIYLIDMIRIIESSEIISFIIVNETESAKSSTLKVPISKVRTYARNIESTRSDLRVECDLISIDAFRCKFKHNISIKNGSILVRNIPMLKPQVVRYMPSADVVSLLQQI